MVRQVLGTVLVNTALGRECLNALVLDVVIPGFVTEAIRPVPVTVVHDVIVYRRF